MSSSVLHEKRWPLKTPRYETHPLANSQAFAFYDFRSNANPFEWHYHPEVEFIYWHTARGIRIVGDSIENFRDGDLCLIGANLPHTWSIVVAPGQIERNIQIQFLPDCLGLDFMALEEARALHRLIQKAAQGLRIIGPTRKKMAARLLHIARTKPKPAKRFCQILDLLMDLSESPDLRPLASAPTAVSYINPRTDRAVSRALEFAHAHLTGGGSQAEAAALLRMSPAAFSRFFRRRVGKTYTGFVNQMRIGRVCSHLPQNDRTIAEIAYAAGFENLSHFNQQFQKHRRMTPSQYRRLVLKQCAAA